MHWYIFPEKTGSVKKFKMFFWIDHADRNTVFVLGELGDNCH